MAKANIRDMLPGGVDLYVQDAGGGSDKVSLVPQQESKRQKTRAGFCGVDRDQFCRESWPVGLLGPNRPITPVSIPTIDLEACGQFCRSNDECGGVSKWDSGCRCMIPKTGVMSDPLNPLLPLGRCLVLTSAILNQAGSLFGKRDNQMKPEINETAYGDNLTTDQYYNLTIYSEYNQTSYNELNAKNYSDLFELTEIIDVQSPPTNLTTWWNETSLRAYSSLDTVPSYIWCACNCTCASWGCCSARNGIVHELSTYNKGAIANCTSEIRKDDQSQKGTAGIMFSASIEPIGITTAMADVTSKPVTASTMDTATSLTTSSIPEPSVCTTERRSAVRACQSWCTCNAPPVSLFFWFKGKCGLRNKDKRSLVPTPNGPPGSPPFLDPLAHRSIPPPNILSTDSTARQLLGTSVTSDDLRRPPGGAINGLPVLGYQATMDSMPGQPLPAPCNESYVSFACADSVDGIVYEGPEFWLGALFLDGDDGGDGSRLPPAPEAWLRVNGLDESFNHLNKVISS